MPSLRLLKIFTKNPCGISDGISIVALPICAVKTELSFEYALVSIDENTSTQGIILGESTTETLTISCL